VHKIRVTYRVTKRARAMNNMYFRALQVYENTDIKSRVLPFAKPKSTDYAGIEPL